MTMTNPTNPHLHPAKKIAVTPVQKPDVVLTGTWLSETEKAIKFEAVMADTKVLIAPKTDWIPKSQIKSKTENTECVGEDTLTISNWIAMTKGYI